MNKKLLIPFILLLVVLSFFVGQKTATSSETTSEIANEEIKQTQIIENDNEYLSHDAYKLLYNLLDYKDETIYVIGHKSPDTDTVTSAMVMANLLNELGIKAEARVTANVNSETAYVLKYFNIEAPQILDNASEKQVWLVDHSESTQAVDGIEDARIVGIIDHHGVGNLSNEEQIFIRSSKYGSTTCGIYILYKECGIEISKDVSRLMLAGLLSDTAFFKNEDNILNREVYDELLKIAEIEDINELEELMKEGKLDFTGKTDEEIFYNDYKDYEEGDISYGIANIKVATVADIEDMANRMCEVAKNKINVVDNDYLFFYIYDFDYEKGYLGCVSKDQNKALEFLKKAFGDTYEFESDYIVTMPSLSRKSGIVPRINYAINN